jgi:hypothetical protein
VSTSVSPANHHSTSFSIIIITRDWHNRPISGRSAEWTQLESTPYCTNKNKLKRIRKTSRTGEMRNPQSIYVENLKGKNHLRDLCVDVRIILMLQNMS